MDIVPAGTELLLEARVAPTDIDEVHAGLEAQVHLLAYRAATCPASRARCARSRPTAWRTRTTGSPTTSPGSRSPAPVLPAGVTSPPGMPADVMIVTGERTLLAYLLRPITAALRRGLRES